jgi:hypothetical protein
MLAQWSAQAQLGVRCPVFPSKNTKVGARDTGLCRLESLVRQVRSKES